MAQEEQLLVAPRQRRGRLGQVRHQHRDRRVAAERRRAGEQFVKKDAQAVLVGATIDLQAARVDANVTYYGGSAGTFSSGRPEVNATHFAGTAYATAVTNWIASLFAAVVEGSITFVQSLRLANAANSGITSGLGTTTVLVKDPGGTKTRVTATVDSNGNRSAITNTDLS